MKSIIRIPLLLAAVLTILLLTGCVSIPMIPTGDGLIIGQSYHLASGQTLSNDLTVVGGNATLDEGSTVNGNVAVIGGNVSVDGTVNGDVSVIGSDVSLEQHAVVQGSVDTIGGTVRRASGAVVEGKTVDHPSNIPHITTLQTPAMHVSFDPITAPLMAIFQALALAALAVVAALFAAGPMDRTGRTAISAAPASGGVGCLTILVLVVMAITIILLPVSLLGFLVVGVAALFGWLALGLLVGRQLAILLKQNWTDPVSAGIGTLAISLLGSLLGIVPCIGWIPQTLAGLVALGAVILTRFGTQGYPTPYGGAAITRPGPYTPPAPIQPVPQPEARVYPPESDQPGENPPAGPDENNIA